MHVKQSLVIVAALAAIVGVSVLAYRSAVPEHPPLCQICQRAIPKETGFRMETATGTILACCARCAMHHMIHEPGLFKKAWATDYVSRRMISAQSAYYDEGGDVHYCTPPGTSVERQPEGVRVRVYDRCLPTLVAFATREEATTYQRQHGGRVLTYDEAWEGVRQQSLGAEVTQSP